MIAMFSAFRGLRVCYAVRTYRKKTRSIDSATAQRRGRFARSYSSLIVCPRYSFRRANTRTRTSYHIVGYKRRKCACVYTIKTLRKIYCFRATTLNLSGFFTFFYQPCCHILFFSFSKLIGNFFWTRVPFFPSPFVFLFPSDPSK